MIINNKINNKLKMNYRLNKMINQKTKIYHKLKMIGKINHKKIKIKN